jgi:hypothetical protein
MEMRQEGIGDPLAMLLRILERPFGKCPKRLGDLLGDVRRAVETLLEMRTV